MRGRLVSQSTPTLRHSTNKPPHSDAPTTVQRGKRSTAARVPRHRASSHTVRQQQYLGRRARVSHSKSPTECTVHVVLSVLCNSAVVQEATHACVSVVGGHRSVTTSRIIDRQPNFFRKLLCSIFGIPRRFATSVFNHSTYHSIVRTACVMLSTDSIRRESHAAARDVLQPLPTQRNLYSTYRTVNLICDELFILRRQLYDILLCVPATDKLFKCSASSEENDTSAQ